MNSRQRKIYYQALVDREGEECAICGKVGNRTSLVIDHKDNDNSNNDPQNHQLLCRSCNGRKNPRGKTKKQSTMRENEIDYLRTKESSAELAKSEKCKPLFKKWVREIIKEHKSMTVSDIVNAGAEKVDLSQQTIMRYLQGMCSFVGDYEMYVSDDKRFVRFKPEYALKVKSEEKMPTNEKVISIKSTETG